MANYGSNMKNSVQNPFDSRDWQAKSRPLRRHYSMSRKRNCIVAPVVVILLAAPVFARAQDTAAQNPSSSYQPKFPGDPARSDSEAAALAYMRVVIRAQHQFNKHYGHYATTLSELVHSGSFTRRMVDPDRGDYTVGFKGKKDSYILMMTPNHLDADHRSFYAEDDGKMHADEEKPADDKSPVVK